MSRKIKTSLAFAVLATFIVGGATANAAIVGSPVQRHQHPEMGFHLRNHSPQSFTISRALPSFCDACLPTSNRQPAGINSAPVVTRHHNNGNMPTSVKPITWRSWHTMHSHS